MTGTAVFTPRLAGEWTVPQHLVPDVRLVAVRVLVDLLAGDRDGQTNPGYLGCVVGAVELAEVLDYIGVPGDRVVPGTSALTGVQAVVLADTCRYLTRFVDRHRAEIIDGAHPNRVRREWLELFVAPAAAARRVIEAMVFS